MNAPLRRAKARDAAALDALERACFTQDRQSPRSLRYLLARACSEVWYVPGEGADGWRGGMILLLRTRSRVVRVYSIAVSPAARGQGIGQQLLAQAERRARVLGCDRLRSEIRRDNTPSRKLFESAGYIAFARTPDYYEDGMEAVRYEKRL